MADQLAEDLVAGFDAIFGGARDGLRAAHAKGTCCAATFTATPDAAALTRAPHMQGRPMRTTVRFSHGSGDPEAHDGGREPRGMAVKFHLDEKRSTDIVAINQPVFITKTPEEFLEFVRLRKPDPETGLPDMAALGAFVAARPEAMRAAQILIAAVPIASFLQTEFFGIHAFRFLDAGGAARFGRYRFSPGLGVASLTPDEGKARSRDFLREDLLERLAKEPATFALRIQIADDSDDPTDPTAEWPAERKEIVAGTLEITGPVEDGDAGCERLLFDPGFLCDGIEQSGDPILAVRTPAYAVSMKRRARARR